MSGFDPEAIFVQLAAAFEPETVGVDVLAFPIEAPPFPVLGFFFVGYREDTQDHTGTMTVEARTAFTGMAEDSLRALYKIVSRGAGHAESVVDTILADRTLAGIVHDIRPGDVRIDAAGTENAGLFIGTVVLEIITDRWD